MADKRKRLQHTAEEIDANLSEVSTSKGSCSCLSERLAGIDATTDGLQERIDEMGLSVVNGAINITFESEDD